MEEPWDYTDNCILMLTRIPSFNAVEVIRLLERFTLADEVRDLWSVQYYSEYSLGSREYVVPLATEAVNSLLLRMRSTPIPLLGTRPEMDMLDGTHFELKIITQLFTAETMIRWGQGIEPEEWKPLIWIAIDFLSEVRKKVNALPY